MAVTKSKPPTLTGQERKVLRLLAQGRTNAEIAFKLKITYDTAKTYVKRLRAKVGGKTRTALAVWGAKHLGVS